MLELKNISFLEYSLLEDKSEYDFAIKYSKVFNTPVNHLSMLDLIDLSFETVKQLQQLFSRPVSWDEFLPILELITCKPIKDICAMPVLAVFQQKEFILSQLSQINEAEENNLYEKPTCEQMEAGINELSKFGYYYQTRGVAITFGLDPDIVKKWSYFKVFNEMCADKCIKEYEKNLISLRNKNNN